MANHPNRKTKAAKPLFPVGARVWILNRTFSGQFVVEGAAEIRKHLDGHHYKVRFYDDGYETERFVDPKVQARPHEFVASLRRTNPNFTAPASSPLVARRNS